MSPWCWRQILGRVYVRPRLLASNARLYTTDVIFCTYTLETKNAIFCLEIFVLHSQFMLLPVTLYAINRQTEVSI